MISMFPTSCFKTEEPNYLQCKGTVAIAQLIKSQRPGAKGPPTKAFQWTPWSGS